MNIGELIAELNLLRCQHGEEVVVQAIITDVPSDPLVFPVTDVTMQEDTDNTTALLFLTISQE